MVWCINAYKRYNKKILKIFGKYITFPDERRTQMSIGNKKSKKIITIIFGIILVLLIILLVVLTGHKRSLAKQEATKKAEAKAEKGLSFRISSTTANWK